MLSGISIMICVFLFGAADKGDVSLTTSLDCVSSFLQAPKHANRLTGFEDPKP